MTEIDLVSFLLLQGPKKCSMLFRGFEHEKLARYQQTST